MPDGHIDITFTCKACGKKMTQLSLPDDPTDDSIAVCNACGVEVGRYGDIKAEAKRAAIDRMKSQLRKTFSGTKGFRVK